MAATLQSLSDLKGSPAAPAEAPRHVQKLDKQGRAYATGKRKNAVARVWIKPGKGVITVNGSTAASSVGANVTLTLKPSYGSNGSVTWSCIGSPARYMPSNCVSISAQAIPIPPPPSDPGTAFSNDKPRSGSNPTPTPVPTPSTPRCWDGVSRDANGFIQTVPC